MRHGFNMISRHNGCGALFLYYHTKLYLILYCIVMATKLKIFFIDNKQNFTTWFQKREIDITKIR